jgi:hypothetical protein
MKVPIKEDILQMLEKQNLRDAMKDRFLIETTPEKPDHLVERFRHQAVFLKFRINKLPLTINRLYLGFKVQGSELIIYLESLDDDSRLVTWFSKTSIETLSEDEFDNKFNNYITQCSQFMVAVN